MSYKIALLKALNNKASKGPKTANNKSNLFNRLPDDVLRLAISKTNIKDQAALMIASKRTAALVQRDPYVTKFVVPIMQELVRFLRTNKDLMTHPSGTPTAIQMRIRDYTQLTTKQKAEVSYSADDSSIFIAYKGGSGKIPLTGNLLEGLCAFLMDVDQKVLLKFREPPKLRRNIRSTKGQKSQIDNEPKNMMRVHESTAYVHMSSIYRAIFDNKENHGPNDIHPHPDNWERFAPLYLDMAYYIQKNSSQNAAQNATQNARIAHDIIPSVDSRLLDALRAVRFSLNTNTRTFHTHVQANYDKYVTRFLKGLQDLTESNDGRAMGGLNMHITAALKASNEDGYLSRYTYKDYAMEGWKIVKVFFDRDTMDVATFLHAVSLDEEDPVFRGEVAALSFRPSSGSFQSPLEFGFGRYIAHVPPVKGKPILSWKDVPTILGGHGPVTFIPIQGDENQKRIVMHMSNFMSSLIFPSGSFPGLTLCKLVAHSGNIKIPKSLSSLPQIVVTTRTDT